MPAPQLTQPIQQAAAQQAFQTPTQNAAQGAPQVPSDMIQFDPARLADIHLPEAITFWPPAPGWWLLLGLFIIILLVIIYFVKRTPPIKKPTVKQLKSQAMKEFDAIKKNYEAQKNNKENTHKTIKDLSIFLRRYILSIYSREKVASLTEQQWLLLLDKTYHSHSREKKNYKSNLLFSEKYAALLTQAPYQPADQFIDYVLLEELFDSSEALINKSARLFSHKISFNKNTSQENTDRVNPAPLLKRRGFVQSSLCTLHPRPEGQGFMRCWVNSYRGKNDV